MIGKFVVIDTLNNFKSKLSSIPSSAIVLIKDVGQIYAHGTYFGAQKTYELLNQEAAGLAPAGGINANGQISNVNSEWVLTVTNGKNPSWKKLPANAFSNDSFELKAATTTDLGGIKVGSVYNGLFSTLTGKHYAVNIDNAGLAYVSVPWDFTDQNVKQTATSLLNEEFSLLFSHTADDSTHTEGTRKASNLKFNPSTGTLTTTTLKGNLDGSYINKLTGYSKASTKGSISSSDSLNTALGKLEYKTDVVYDLVDASKPDSTTIDTLKEVLNVLSGITDTQTIQGILGNYVTLAGTETITGQKTFTGDLKIKHNSFDKSTRIFNYAPKSTENVKTIIQGSNWTHGIELYDSYGSTSNNDGLGLNYASLIGGYTQDSRLILKSYSCNDSSMQSSEKATTVISTGNSSFSGQITAPKFITSGGTSTQCVMGDGSITDKPYYMINTHSITDLNAYTRYSSGLTMDLFDRDSSNKPAGGNNANGVLTADFGLHGNTNPYGFQLACMTYNKQLYFRSFTSGTFDDWKIIAFTDSDITGNAATATKLKNSVTLWGQSFDGSSNVSGHIYISNNNAVNNYDSNNNSYRTLMISGGNELLIGHDSSLGGIPTYIHGSTIILRYNGTNNGLRLNQNGNVTIGSLDLASSDYKLYIDGKTYISNNLIIKGPEISEIKTLHNADKSITVNSPSSIASIKHALQFIWRNSSWEIGNIRNNSDGTNGFGITYGNSDLRFRVTTTGAVCYGNMTSTGFVKSESSDEYMLLGGGGHKAISTFYDLTGGTEITSSKNLNDYTTVGNYHCKFDNTSKTLSNCPVTTAFTLRVYAPTGNASSFIAQKVEAYGSSLQYKRIYNVSNQTWTTWIYLSPDFTNYNANSADKLKNSVYLWGQEFNGTQNLDGNIRMGFDGGGIGYKADTKTWTYFPIYLHNNTDSAVFFRMGLTGGNNTFSYFWAGPTQSTFVINSSSDVGIGTSSPTSKLHVVGSGYFSSSLSTNGDLSLNGVIKDSKNYIKFSGSAEEYKLTQSSKYGYVVSGTTIQIVNAFGTVNGSNLISIDCGTSSSTTNSLYFGAVNSGLSNNAANFVIGRRTGTQTWEESLRIDTSGNVGVGTTSPTRKFQVNGIISSKHSSYSHEYYINPHSAGFDICSTGNLAPHYATNFAIYKGTPGSGECTLYINSDKNIGIGTQSPTTKLEVNGTVKASAFSGTASNASKIENVALLDIPKSTWIKLGKNGSSEGTIRWNYIGDITTGTGDDVENDALIEFEINGDQNYPYARKGHLHINGYGATSRSLILYSVGNKCDAYATLVPNSSTSSGNCKIYLGLAGSYTGTARYRILRKGSKVTLYTSNISNTTTAPNSIYISHNGTLKSSFSNSAWTHTVAVPTNSNLNSDLIDGYHISVTSSPGTASNTIYFVT